MQVVNYVVFIFIYLEVLRNDIKIIPSIRFDRTPTSDTHRHGHRAIASIGLGKAAAVPSAAVGGCREVTCSLLPVVAVAVVIADSAVI